MLDLAAAIGEWHPLLGRLHRIIRSTATWAGRPSRVPPCRHCGAPAWTTDVHRNVSCRACFCL
jgi:hypothetical protein